MINICELLKDCPIGTKLYCSMFGICELSIACNSFIHINTDQWGILVLDCYGRLGSYGDVVIFPSKEQRDWSKFKAPQPLPDAGDLCWTMTSVGNWVPRYATGLKDDNGNPIFFDRQDKNKRHTISLNNWRKWCDFNELINEK